MASQQIRPVAHLPVVLGGAARSTSLRAAIPSALRTLRLSARVAVE